MRNAEQRCDDGMATRLGLQAFACVHQNQRKVGSTGAGHHIARVLLVAWRIGDDEAAFQCREIAVSHIDGDPLLAFRREAICQERKIDALPTPTRGGVLDG